jgi:hypothetical protein
VARLRHVAGRVAARSDDRRFGEIREVASVPAKLTVRGFRYQPLPSGGRSTDGVTAGGVTSYLKPKLALLELPATSVHEPDTETEAPSPLSYDGLVHDATPDIASVPENATDSGLLYHAPESGGRDGLLPVTWGGVASRRTVIVRA